MPVTRITSFVGAITAATLLTASIAAAQSSQNRSQEVRPSTTAGIFDSRSPSHIILGGRDMGTDPDPRIRAYMGRDTGMAFGGNF
jgi:cytidylate kinase